MAVKGKSAPYARRSVWYAVVAMAVVVVVGFGVGGYAVYHLHNQVNGLEASVTSLHQDVSRLNSEILQLVYKVAALVSGR